MSDRRRAGVIDLGTNTFHLLIVDIEADGRFREVFRRRHFVKLAAGGIERIDAAAFKRGLEAMTEFAAQLRRYGVDRFRAIGTAALRTATNGPDFVIRVATATGIEIELIDGEQEADYIARGTLLGWPAPTERILIMDIGGGSVEFIIADGQQRYFAHSYPAGIAVLHKRFHRHDPILTSEVASLNEYLDATFRDLPAALKTFPTDHLVGSAGMFEVLAEAFPLSHPAALVTPIDLNAFSRLAAFTRTATRTERRDHPAIPASRADMFTVGTILIEWVLDRLRPTRMTAAKYAMKEGVLLSMM